MLHNNPKYLPITSLIKGDYIISPSGKHVKITDIKEKSHHLNEIIKNNRPIKISKSSLTKNVPTKDLFISGYHRIIVKENDKSYIGIQAHKLVPEFATEKDLTPYLTNDKITYYHIELEDQNEWLFANGVPVESWQK